MKADGPALVWVTDIKYSDNNILVGTGYGQVFYLY